MKMILDKTLLTRFEEEEFAAAELVKSALQEVHRNYGNINDATIKKNNEAPSSEYVIDMSLTTLKNYVNKWSYRIENIGNATCIMKQFTISEYREIKNRLNNKTNETSNVTKTMTAKQRLGFELVEKSEKYKCMKMLSLRCSFDIIIGHFHVDNPAN